MWTDQSVRPHRGVNEQGHGEEAEDDVATRSPCLARREEILQTATELFADQGFSDAVTQVLADRLQIGKGTLYRHFPSKRELFLATADRVMVKMNERITASIAGITRRSRSDGRGNLDLSWLFLPKTRILSS